MPSTIFVDRAHKFAEHLHDKETKSRIERYLRQSDFIGPVITFVGAEGRGKSTLLGKAAQVIPSPSTKVQFAGISAWKKAVNAMASNSVFQIADQNGVADMLLCEAPPFGTTERDNIVSSLLGMTDLAVMAVQITQPAGLEEAAFVQEHLAGIASVLVLTKCDHADEQDFQEGLDAILENYGSFPWLAILLSDLSGQLTETTACGQSIKTFEQWWQSEAQIRAEEARQAHLRRLQQGWREQAKSFLDTKENEFAPQFRAVRESLSVSASATQAQKLQDDLLASLKVLPENALALYQRRLPDLRRVVNEVTHPITDGIKKGAEVNLPLIERTLSKVYQEWDEETRISVRDDMQTMVERLHEAASRYDALIREATKSKAATEMVQATGGSQEVVEERLSPEQGLELHGNFGLTISDKIRTVATPTVSALGAGFLLFNVIGATIFWPLAPIIAVAAAVATGIGLSGSNNEANQRRLAVDLENAIRRQSADLENQLQQQFRSEWKQFSDNVRDSVSASKRQLTLLLMHQSDAQDATLSAKYKDLTSNMAKIKSLRRDLRWLEDHEAGARLVADTEV